MNKKIPVIILIVGILIMGGMLSVVGQQQAVKKNIVEPTMSNGYGIQWSMDYGSDPRVGARYEGPQPIGDADNDGKNELLISGRDCAIRVMKWDDNQQTYEQVRVLRPPFYPFIQCDAGGMAIGDLTGDGKNEVAATWYSAVYHYFLGKYWMIGANPWIFMNGGGSADCLIGDCDNDGKNELIMSGGPGREDSPVPEITVLKWNGLWLKHVAGWKASETYGYVYMAGLGDVDDDGENEIVCAHGNTVVALSWDAETKVFESTVVSTIPSHEDSPFGCVCKDCDNDGKAEVLLSYYGPRISIFKWNGTGYATQFDISWPEGDPVIEGIDVGDTDDDGLNEVCAGAGVTHILQWNGSTYVEEAVLPTFGWMAVVSIGDCDNDGKNEINAGNVDVGEGQNFTEWVFKYGWGS